jgi:hypothetical protein
MSFQLRYLFIVLTTVYLAALAEQTGYADTLYRPKPPAKASKTSAKKKKSLAKRSRAKHSAPPLTPTANPEMMSLADTGYPLSRNWDRPKNNAGTLAMTPTASAPSNASATTAVAPETPPNRIVNFRIHPIYLVDMIARSDTQLAFRADVDFLVSDHFTLGPSVTYQQTVALDGLLSNTATINLTQIEIGLLSNIYFTGTSSTGGLLLRPHVYYIDISGDKEDSQSQVVATGAATNGWRTGAELVYQKILPFGLNFEIGGGFTYYAVPYSVTYSDNAGTKSSGPSNSVVPTVTLGVGWAF